MDTKQVLTVGLAVPGAVSAQLMLHAKPAHAGPYALWIQFKGGDKIRTVPFLVTVPAAS
ncbi:MULTISPECIES: hypothetical protein [unclassified Pseudomonas]|jgi:hypothetical protein|uniref:hypothetical protein n=1 Tax=unclassified Pseudomonas TaxID=196821 RepID=UPI001359F688|nr:hypothetical protein [Pseudomonas sp. Irchel 3H3]